MNSLVITNRGMDNFNRLRNNPNFVLNIEKVKFSNISQNLNTVINQNELFGTLAEGLILTHFYSKDNAERLNIIAFLPRKAFPAPNYVVQSIGVYNINNELIATMNISPSGFHVGVIVKANINLSNLNITKEHKKRIRLKEFYHISYDRLILNMMVSTSDDNCLFENYMYHFFDMYANGDHVSRGIYVRERDNKYRIFIDPNNYLLFGETV